MERAALGDAFNLAASGRLAMIILEGEAGSARPSSFGEALDDVRRHAGKSSPDGRKSWNGLVPSRAERRLQVLAIVLGPGRAAIGELLAKGRSP